MNDLPGIGKETLIGGEIFGVPSARLKVLNDANKLWILRSFYLTTESVGSHITIRFRSFSIRLKN